MSSPEWFGRDHVLVVQAAANLEAAPLYARQIWATADDPATAAMQVIAALVKERAEVMSP